jgi:hypothetical protein
MRVAGVATEFNNPLSPNVLTVGHGAVWRVPERRVWQQVGAGGRLKKGRSSVAL